VALVGLTFTEPAISKTSPAGALRHLVFARAGFISAEINATLQQE
jgi:hypothetical protein